MVSFQLHLESRREVDSRNRTIVLTLAGSTVLQHREANE